jgi:hypothetical protein
MRSRKRGIQANKIINTSSSSSLSESFEDFGFLALFLNKLLSFQNSKFPTAVTTTAASKPMLASNDTNGI